MQHKQVTVEEIDLELSERTGALIISTDNTRAWQHIHIDLYTGAARYDFHEKRSATLGQHRINGRIVWAAVFSGLALGDYRAFATGRHAQVTPVTIRAGEVSTAHWI